MKVIVCGAGQVGWQIARQLSGEKNDVTVVDNNPDLVREVQELKEDLATLSQSFTALVES